MTKRKENPIKLNDEFLASALIEAVKDALIVTDPQGKIQLLNQSTLTLSGYAKQELIGQNLSVLMPEELFLESSLLANEQPKMWGVLRTKTAEDVPIHYNYGFIFDQASNITNIVYLAKDIREYKQTEEELIRAYQDLKNTQQELVQSEKMAAIGRLAAGMAHEIRNPLAVMVQGLHLLETLISRGKDELVIGDLKETFSIIGRSVKRVDEIVNHLLGYSRIPITDFVPNDICEIIDEGISFVEESTTLANIQVIRKYPTQPLIVRSERVILSQVFVNLMTNALDALTAGGIITVEVTQEENSCLIKFSDNGKGIAPKSIAKIFEPFYSTKETGKGTGLGLAMVHLIVERHRGTITVESVIERGTTFVIRLPLVG